MKRFIFFAFFTIFISCDKADSTQTETPASDNFILNENVLAADESFTAHIEVIEDGHFILSKGLPQSLLPADGQIVCASITENTPEGLMGRVVSVEDIGTGYKVTTEAVGLSDVFKELHVDTSMDISEYVQTAEDESGATFLPEMVSDQTWDYLSEHYQDSISYLPTKASLAIPEKTVKLPFKSKAFDGSLYTKFQLDARIDISEELKVNSFNISITKKTGIEGEWTVTGEAETEFELAKLEFEFAGVPVPGTPIVLIPTVYLGLSASFEAHTELVTSFKYRFENRTYIFGYDGKKVSFDNRNVVADEERYFKFESFNGEEAFTFSFGAGAKVSLWDDRVLALGAENTANLQFKAQGAITMDDTELLRINPGVSVTPYRELSLYAESILFKPLPGNDDGRFSLTYTAPIDLFEIPAMPTFSDITTSRTEHTLSASAVMNPESLLRCSEKGFALFEAGKGTPVGHKRFIAGAAGTKTSQDEVQDRKEVVFDNLDNGKSYSVKPYVVADNKYYYGAGKKKRVKSAFTEDFKSIEFTYETNNRITAIKFIEYDGESHTTTITYHDENETATVNEDGYIYTIRFLNGKLQQFAGKQCYYDANGCITDIGEWWGEWDGNNIVRCTTMSDDNSYNTFTYGNYVNTLNIDIWGEYIFCLPASCWCFPGPITQKLPKTCNCSNGNNATFSYKFDNDGYVIECKEHYSNSVPDTYSGTNTYSVEYEEYYD